jgi:hypothetical protein
MGQYTLSAVADLGTHTYLHDILNKTKNFKGNIVSQVEQFLIDSALCQPPN